MQDHAKVVVVGGGCVGASILYGLTQHGCTDCVMLERTRLTAGSTWHAAGLLVTFVRSHTISQMTMETIRIYAEVERKLGTSVGLRQVGQLRVANSQARWDEFQSYMPVAEAAGVPCRLLTPAEITEVHPLLVQSPHIRGGILHDRDGYINPADITMGLAKLARDQGAAIYQNTEATAYDALPGGGWRVTTSQGAITCEHLVFATGNYARENARRVGLDLPCIPIVHQYWTTESVPELMRRRGLGLPEFPILRDEDYGGYLREDVGSFQFGPYEITQDLKLFAENRVPPAFGADLLPEDFEAVEAQWSRAVERVPALGEVGIRSNTRGPFQMTPDELPLCGPAPGRANLWLAEGVPGGILWGGTMGERLARWIVTGDPGIDMAGIDPRRFGDHASRRWTMDKVRGTWGTHMNVHVPGEDLPHARPMKTVPSYDLLTAHGAVWTTLNGYECPRWFAPSPALAVPDHGFRHTAHLDHVRAEVRAVREQAGFIEMSPMTKFTVRGPGAAAWLDGLLANCLPKVGRMTLSVLCNDGGGIEAEFTVLRMAEEDFTLISTPNGQVCNWDLLSRALPLDGSVALADVSEARGVIAVAGPRARDVLQPLTDTDLSNAAFPFLSVRRGEVGYAKDVDLLRVSYTGELGWELYHPIGYNRHLVDLLLKAGVRPFGLEALESMRLDKSFRAIHRELRRDVTPLEAGLERFVALDGRSFPGRDAVLRQKIAGDHPVLVTLALPRGETSAIADEAVCHDGTVIGRVTSGGYSCHFDHDIAMALVPARFAGGKDTLQVRIHDDLRPARVVQTCLHDPGCTRARG